MVRSIEVKFDEKKLKEIQRSMSVGREMNKLMYRVIDKTAKGSRTQIVNALAGEIALKKTIIRNAIRYQKPSYTRWMAQLDVFGTRIPLLDFSARQTKKGVSYKIDKKGKREKILHAFIGDMRSGHRGVFKRSGTDENLVGRLGINEKFGPSLGGVFENAGNIAAEIQRDAGERLVKNADAQLALMLEKRRAA